MSESRYLVSEAFPDWKHKAARIEHEWFCRGTTGDSGTDESKAERAFAKWLSTLRDEVLGWKMNAEAIEIPDFNQAVIDLTALRARRRASETTETASESELIDGGLEKIEKLDSGIEL